MLKFSSLTVFLLAALFVNYVYCGNLFWKNLQLEPSLLKFAILSSPSLREKCLLDKHCPVELNENSKQKCWGFESDCELEDSYSSKLVKCSGKSDWLV